MIIENAPTLSVSALLWGISHRRQRQGEMIKVEQIEKIRRAYFIEGKSIREISRQYGHCRRTVRKAIQDSGPREYRLEKDRPQPVIGPYKARIDELLAESKQQPRKQRYTAHRIYDLIFAEGYLGGESTVRRYVGRKRDEMKQRDSYLPLEFDPGQDAQMDWTEGVVELTGKRVKVQLFIMRLNYSKVRFAMAFPFQKQEAFLEGHEQACLPQAGLSLLWWGAAAHQLRQSQNSGVSHPRGT